MATFSFSDLLNRYDMKKSALSRFLTRHINEINHNGVHANKTADGWKFDDEAIRILDGLRGINSIVESDDSVQVQELKEIISGLQTKLLTAYEEKEDLLKEISDVKSQLIVSSQDQIDLTRKLAAASVKLLDMQKKGTKDIEELKTSNQNLSEQLNKKENECKRLLLENKELSDKIDDFKQFTHVNSKGSVSGWNRRFESKKIKIVRIKR